MLSTVARFASMLAVLSFAATAGAEDAYFCQKAKDRKQPKFVGTTLPLSDQFAGPTAADVKKPFLFCSPAGINGRAVENAAAHLVCYKSKARKLAAPSIVTTADELGTLTLEVKKGDLLCVPATAAIQPQATSGSMRVLTYNVAGLPQGISGSNPEVNTPLIAPRLNAYDLVLMQETWQTPNPNPLAPLRVYHEILVAGSEHPFKSVPATHPFNTDPLRPSAILGDGLNRFSRFRFDSVTRQRWSGCHETAADCLALKGFSFARMQLPTGGTVDVYNLHMEAGGSATDDALRDQGVTELSTFMSEHSAGRAVIVGGDFNLHTDEEPDATIFERLLDEQDLTDTCAALGCANPGRIDKLLVRSGGGVTLTPVSYSVETAQFLDENGQSLSDHQPVAVQIDWTVTP